MTRRADALRSREQILAAARFVIDREGPAVSLDWIAREAGVGSATLYRHFPTRHHLLEQVVADRATALADYASELAVLGEPSALHAWTQRLVQEAITDRGLGVVLLETAPKPAPDSTCRERVVRATQRLLEVPSIAASLTTGATAEDLVDAAASVAVIVGDDVRRGQRLMTLWLTGIAPNSPHG